MEYQVSNISYLISQLGTVSGGAVAVNDAPWR
jgi:hypothetical protein